ncbi:MAG TPA: NAD(P)H-binding protein [Actinomycetota bacterium]|nr:NAD(P)H-binding protein [Actinomycetota bacterium]
MIALMGAAGNVGSKVADLLVGAGEGVRALQHSRPLTELRERGAEVVAGDAMSVDELRAFLAGADSALVMLPENVADPAFVEDRRVMNGAIREALSASAVPHVVALSTVGAARADAPGPPGGLYEFEQSLVELDANVLVLRSAAYMDYLLASVPMIQARKMNGSAVKADVRYPLVATQDVAREAAERLRLRDFTGHEVKLLLGPEDISMSEATKVIGSRLGIPDLRYVEFPPGDVRVALEGAGMSPQVARLLVDMQLALNEGVYFEGVRRTPESTTPTRFEGFVAQALSQAATIEEKDDAR